MLYDDFMAQRPTFDVVIYDHDKIVYQGQVWALSSTNDIGPFDVLASHSNFITVVKNQLTLHFDDQKTRFLPVDRGVLRAYRQNVEIYLGISSFTQIESHPSSSPT